VNVADHQATITMRVVPLDELEQLTLMQLNVKIDDPDHLIFAIKMGERKKITDWLEDKLENLELEDRDDRKFIPVLCREIMNGEHLRRASGDEGAKGPDAVNGGASNDAGFSSEF